MGTEFQHLHTLFDRLVADPRSLPAFEDYARAVESAVEDGTGKDAPELAEALARHLEELPALVESRLEGSIDRVTQGLSTSLELEEARSARNLAQALAKAREQLETRHPRVEGRSPEEFVHLNRHQPLRILDNLVRDDADWLSPYLDRARSMLRRSLETPGDPSLDASLASALADYGVLLENLPPRAAAEVAYRTALLYDPGQADARAGLGHLALGFGRGREAELEFRAALDRDAKHARALAGLCELLLEEGRTPEVRPLVDRLLATHPQRPEGYLLAASLELSDGEDVAAVAHLLDAAELDPDHPRPLRLLAAAYARAGHAELAQEYLEASTRRADPRAAPPRLPAALPESPSLPPGLLRPPPAPLLTSPAPEPAGPLTRGEAFGRLLAASLDGDALAPDSTALVLRARGELRITRDEFQALYSEAIASAPPDQDPFDPVALFEDLRRRAWRDGYLSPSERDVLEAVLRCLGIDRRRAGRDRVD